tara:strand:+ start:310 stop:510 length:201 start_codon:yes stop_codon:yes gene_type:complete
MKATEYKIIIAVRPGESMVRAINRIISCVSTGHYQGRTVNEETFIKDNYNFSYSKQNKEYKDIEFN